MGLIILATIFLVPFGSNTIGTTPGDTLYGVVGPNISDLGALQDAGDQRVITYAYIWIVAFILLVIAGLVGIFPLGTGVMGVVGMAMISVSGFLVFADGSQPMPNGAGFYLIWIASIVSLGASFWHGKKKEEKAPVTVNVTQTTTATTAAPASKVKCPNCGTENAAGSAKCSNCGKDLPKAP